MISSALGILRSTDFIAFRSFADGEIEAILKDLRRTG